MDDQRLLLVGGALAVLALVAVSVAAAVVAGEVGTGQPSPFDGGAPLQPGRVLMDWLHADGADAPVVESSSKRRWDHRISRSRPPRNDLPARSPERVRGSRRLQRAHAVPRRRQRDGK